MKLRAFLFAVILLFVPACSESVKEPAVAGTFYPAEEKALREMVDGFLAKAGKFKGAGRPVALISPHAGYQYSGQVAAYSYKQIQGTDINTVILIGASHHKPYTGVSVYAKGSMRTPLGNIKINEKTAKLLLNDKANVVFDAGAFEKEHSLEVQLPFLQRSLKNFTIVPVLVGTPTRESFRHLTDVLTGVLRKDPRAIVIASTDLSHYHDDGTARGMDNSVIDSVSRMSYEDLEQKLLTGKGEMCGGFPVIFTMAVARNMGANRGELFKYANSGDVTGDKERVVGYAAMGLYKTYLTAEEKTLLLDIAKKTVNDYVSTGKAPEVTGDNPNMLANGATFVTIKKHGELRGCIGNTRPIMPLYKSVIANSISAAVRDPRFGPLTKQELKDIKVEVTILSPIEPLNDIKDIVVGKHGLVIVNGDRSGLLLPQVAEEMRWDVKTFLEQLSQKAGLPPDAWKDSQLYSFTAEVVK
ncbi:MAG: AmmeMemoRadiSam system protein B [Nitrospirae bacterium]|nr:MAG: AmmeMemoRadiSam system protein B [Nitrospirota bacterium]